jgi:hypothetical protein
MSFGTPTVIVSGKPHLVLLVSDRAPEDLSEFVDATEFTIDMEGTSYLVQGCGRLLDDEVRYHEKDIGNGGKDIRVWRVIRHADGNFLADHAAAF